MHAREDFNCKIITVFSDIIFDPRIVQRLVGSPHDITIVVDPALLSLPKNQILASKPDLVKAELDPVDDIRVVSRKESNPVQKIGKRVPVDIANYEFIGLAGFSKKGIDTLTKVYDELVSTPDTPFHEAKSFHRASLTDMFQELINRGIPVQTMEVRSGWSEIRTFDDYQRVIAQLASEGS
jgi:phosphoenolpyruvate phosphomutase